MSDRDALLVAILAEPDDDTPRLVYADWLDEHDEPERAEFIRIQHHLPALSRRTAEAKRLILREANLRQKLFKHLDKLPFAEVVIRRGFVESVTSPLHVFGEHAAKLRAEDAPAYELILKPDENDDNQLDGGSSARFELVRSIAECPELRRCIALDPRQYLNGQAAEILFNSPHLTALRRLTAGGDAGDAFEDLDSRVFANLRWLNLHGNDDLDHFPPEIKGLVHSKHLANLEHLDLGSCNLDEECLRAITTTKQLKRLRYLDLSSGGFSDELVKFFHAKNLPALTELDLSDSIGWWERPVDEVNECIKLLFDSPRIERLTKLALRRNRITDAGALAIANSPRKLQLTHLDLWANTISATAKRALEKRLGRGVCNYKQPADPSRR